MKTFVFDLDDTLIRNAYHYVIPYIQLCDFVLKKIDSNHEDFKTLQEILSLSKTELLYGTVDSVREKYLKDSFVGSIFDKLIELDLDNVERRIKEGGQPFNCERLLESFEDSLEYFCKEYEKPCSEEELKLARDLASETFFVSRDFMPGAEEVLDFLKSKGDELVLLTHGDYAWQKEKIEVHDLDKWFYDINIVDLKTSEVVKIVVEGKDKNKTYMVGNSLRSDINPALKAGINAVYIPFETWAFEKASSGLEEGNVFVFSNLSEFMKSYDKLKN